LLADTAGLALLVVPETLAPAERFASVLHEIFDMLPVLLGVGERLLEGAPDANVEPHGPPGPIRPGRRGDEGLSHPLVRNRQGDDVALSIGHIPRSCGVMHVGPATHR
jgi:hypothetical protein